MKKTNWTKRIAVGVMSLSLLTGIVHTAQDARQAQPQISDEVGASTAVKFAKTTYQTTAALNVRSGASTKHKVLTVIPKGVKITSDTRIGNWYKVTYKGKTGYVSGGYLKKVANPSKPAPKPSQSTGWISKASAEQILQKKYEKESIRSYTYSYYGSQVGEAYFLNTKDAKAMYVLDGSMYLSALKTEKDVVGEDAYKEWKIALKEFNIAIQVFAETQVGSKYAGTFQKEVENFAMKANPRDKSVKTIGGKRFVFEYDGDYIIEPK